MINTQSPLWQSTTNRLIAVCVVAYFLVEGIFQGMPSGLELYYFEHPDFRLWQPLTSIFLHGGIVHLALNMFVLWSFGRILEQVWGASRFLLFFLLCGIGAGLISLLVNYFSYHGQISELMSAGASLGDLNGLVQQGQISQSLLQISSKEELSQLYYLYNAPMVGASGAIYGILVAFAILFPNFKLQLIFLPIPLAAKYFVPILLCIDLLAGFTGVSIFGLNVAHFAHVGGAIVGFVLVMLWMQQAKQS